MTLTVIALALFAYVPAAQAATCGGKDLIAELEREQPSQFREVADEAARTSNGEALLWRVEADGNRPVSYLFGTIHLTDDRVANLTDPVRDGAR